ncbi:MAG: exosortase/archaeosortase family protein, partial [Bacteroidota bacterium]
MAMINNIQDVLSQKWDALKYWYKRQSDLNRFLIKGGMLLIAWLHLRLFIFFIPEFRLFFKPFVYAALDLLTYSSYHIVTLFYDHVNLVGDVIRIADSGGIKLIIPCLGINIMFWYMAFLLIYPGSKWSKLRWIPLGVAFLFLMNIFRVVMLVILSYEAPDMLKFYHVFFYRV